MKVTLLTHTPEPDKVVAAAARVCYSAKGGDELFDNLTDDKAAELVKKLVSMGHESPFEHVSFTFAIDGVSRALSHQLVRHRIGVSFSQKSQRYVKEKGGADFVIPHSIEKDPELLGKYQKCLDDIMAVYSELAEAVPPEDARYLLPNATCTNLVVTMNGRSLLHFCQLRSCNRAQWEIRELSNKMLAEAQKVAPVLLANAGPTCVSLGICFEGEKTCGRASVARGR